MQVLELKVKVMGKPEEIREVFNKIQGSTESVTGCEVKIGDIGIGNLTIRDEEYEPVGWDNTLSTTILKINIAGGSIFPVGKGAIAHK